MSESERWQLGGNAPEVYERELVPAIFAPWAPLLVAKVALREGEHALDVACGTGVVTRLAAARLGREGHVVGLDLNPGMLARARAAAPPDGAAVEWREGDAGAMPFGSATFDAVLCQLGLQYFPDRQQAAREMRRVLKPGGRLAVLVWRALAHSPGFAALTAALERHVGPAAAAVMRAPFVFGDATNDLRALLVRAGFGTVRVSADVRMVRFASPAALVYHQVAGSPLASHVASVDDGVRDAVIREVTAAMQPYVSDDGLAFPIEGHIAVASP
ncbi:MAG TPA: methyltransferase domain-containing protein [Verrucomicrobiae bacterium]|nr:methyltransferase domain-containing protein [Verrucomicrobiae bacterium]